MDDILDIDNLEGDDIDTSDFLNEEELKISNGADDLLNTLILYSKLLLFFY